MSSLQFQILRGGVMVNIPISSLGAPGSSPGCAPNLIGVLCMNFLDDMYSCGMEFIELFRYAAVASIPVAVVFFGISIIVLFFKIIRKGGEE